MHINAVQTDNLHVKLTCCVPAITTNKALAKKQTQMMIELLQMKARAYSKKVVEVKLTISS